jgi:hypothetical protein
MNRDTDYSFKNTVHSHCSYYAEHTWCRRISPLCAYRHTSSPRTTFSPSTLSPSIYRIRHGLEPPSPPPRNPFRGSRLEMSLNGPPLYSQVMGTSEFMIEKTERKFPRGRLGCGQKNSRSIPSLVFSLL